MAWTYIFYYEQALILLRSPEGAWMASNRGRNLIVTGGEGGGGGWGQWSDRRIYLFALRPSHASQLRDDNFHYQQYSWAVFILTYGVLTWFEDWPLISPPWNPHALSASFHATSCLTWVWGCIIHTYHEDDWAVISKCKRVQSQVPVYWNSEPSSTKLFSRVFQKLNHDTRDIEQESNYLKGTMSSNWSLGALWLCKNTSLVNAQLISSNLHALGL